ncbi:MAG TPA: alpha-L-rhamnosidase N-terminal domain-containing protein, partial [Gemmatimonadaceae bacterium]|nr:alpha-L-rhamnosidase N-terminal domain-containing protein [Gemmatimonadaceae bacterium]
MLRYLVCLMLVGVALSDAHAQSDSVFAGAPVASWIAPSGIPGDSFVVFHARRSLDLAMVPARFVVHVSADNRYRLFVNGVSVSSGPQRSDVAHWRYETVDIAPQLHPGRNVLAAVVWNWGGARPVAQHSYRGGFVLQGNGAREAALVNTGPGWKLLVDSAYAPIVITNASLRTYYAAAPGEALNASRYPWGWERDNFDDAAWATVREQPAAPAAPLAAFEVPAGGTIVGRFRPLARVGRTYGEVFGWQLTPRTIPAM